MPFSFKSLGLPNRPDDVPHDTLKPILRKIRFIHPEDAEFANNLWPESADFLSGHSLRSLIRDELEDQKVAAEIAAAKEFLDRLSTLLPALSDLFNPSNPDNLEGFISFLDDIWGDYRASLERVRKNRQLREANEVLSAASMHLASAIIAIRAAERFISSDYEHFHGLYFDPNGKRKQFPSIHQLVEEMQVCKAASDMVRAKATDDPQKLHIVRNSGKSLIVDHAHMMSLMWNGPMISTTPGSDFALLCSLLFECASGEADVGLAGAINRYARSPQRFKREDEEAEFHEDEANDDNFADEKLQINRAMREMEESKKLIETGNLDEFAQSLLQLHAHGKLKIIEAASQVYGPRQTRISQLNEEQLVKIRGVEADPRRLQKLDISLGNLRRSINSDAKST